MVSTVSVCQSGCLPFLTHLQHFTSLSLHASALFPHLHPPQTPNPSALLEKKPFTSCRLPHLICRTRNWSPFGLNRRYSLSSLFDMRRVWLSSGVQCLFVLFFVFITVPLAVWKQESAVELLKTDIFSYRAHNLLCALYIFWSYLKPLLAIHVVQFLLHKENNPSCYLPDQTELGYDCSFSS